MIQIFSLDHAIVTYDVLLLLSLFRVPMLPAVVTTTKEKSTTALIAPAATCFIVSAVVTKHVVTVTQVTPSQVENGFDSAIVSHSLGLCRTASVQAFFYTRGRELACMCS